MIETARRALASLHDRRHLAWGALALALVLFVAAQAALAGVNGLWVDEIFSFWASDPALPLGQLFGERIFADSNPPLYFSLLRAARALFDDPRAAFIAVDVLALAATAAFVLHAARRAGVLALGAWALALFLLSGPALCYFPEGRSYFAAMCVVFAAAWAGALALAEQGRGPPWAHFAALGALAALAHVFSGVFAGGLAAGLVLYALFGKRRDLLAPGLALGGATTLVFAIWFIRASAYVGNVGWIEFTPAAILEAVWFVKSLAFGSNFALALLALLWGYGLWMRASRPMAALFAITFGLFAALPLAASFITPIIVGRYWLVGAPGLVVLTVFLARALFADGVTQRSDRSLIAFIGIGAFVLVASVGGYLTAYKFTAEKPVWHGGDVVAPLIAGCPAQSVRVTGEPPFLPAYAAMSGASTGLFLDATQPDAPVGEAEDGQCPVLGWGEHMPMDGAADAQLLQWLKLEAAPGEVRIWRSRSGYVVLRADAAP